MHSKSFDENSSQMSEFNHMHNLTSILFQKAVFFSNFLLSLSMKLFHFEGVWLFHGDVMLCMFCYGAGG